MSEPFQGPGEVLFKKFMCRMPSRSKGTLECEGSSLALASNGPCSCLVWKTPGRVARETIPDFGQGASV